jgi:peptidoglycan hydrolase-like protein with peptidoglycan-binding domain
LPLKTGSRGSEVKRLQEFLNKNPETQVAGAGPGSPGNETVLFGAATRSAIGRFQEKYGIAKSGDAGYGTVGPKTRAKLNELVTSGN